MKINHHPSFARSFRTLCHLVACAFLFVGALPAKAQTDYATVIENTPNLLGYWRFTTASQANSEVNDYTGTFMGGAAVGDANSGPSIAGDRSNTALVLDDATGVVTTSLIGQIDQQGSIVAWFYLTALPSFPNCDSPAM